MIKNLFLKCIMYFYLLSASTSIVSESKINCFIKKFNRFLTKTKS
jgi:hypothetical protein